MPSIINSDDGVVSGTSGLKTTGGNDGLLNIQSNGSTVVAVTGSGISVTGTVSQTGVSTFAAGTVSAPSITFTGDTNTGIFSPAADTIAFTEGGAEAMRINSSGQILFGTGTAATTIGGSTAAAGGPTDKNLTISAWYPTSGTNEYGGDLILAAGRPIGTGSGVSGSVYIRVGKTAGSGSSTGSVIDAITANESTLTFKTADTERARITSGGNFLVGKTTNNASTDGLECVSPGSGFYVAITNSTATSGESPFYINRQGSDGTLIQFRQANADEGSISVSGTTVSYNGGHLSRYAQTQAAKDESLLKGTVLSNLDEMNVYVVPTTYWTEEDELPEGVNVGDVKVETHTVDNEQLNKVKVSDVEGDVNVAGVFVNWSYDEQHQIDEINMAMTGDMIIRIAQGVVVQKGDLLMSAGDGTAKPQGDDIVRSKTVAKVTSNHVTCTYADGSYCVPCVLMAC